MFLCMFGVLFRAESSLSTSDLEASRLRTGNMGGLLWGAQAPPQEGR